jgi:hypothetical protein
MSHRRGTLSTEEQEFLFEVVFPGLDERRDDLDRDLFVLLARRLIEAGYTVDSLKDFITAANESIRRA